MANAIKVYLGPSEDIPEEFNDLVSRCYRENPDKKDLAELREQLKEMPQLATYVFSLAGVILDKVIDCFISQEAARIALNENIANLKRGMRYDESPTLEKLLIENVILTWARLQWAELRHSIFLDGGGAFTEGEYWSKIVSATQRRHLRACESLARVRKITRKTPALQINLAEQQINVAGDLVKSGGYS